MVVFTYTYRGYGSCASLCVSVYTELLLLLVALAAAAAVCRGFGDYTQWLYICCGKRSTVVIC